ncbi:MAG: phosphoribosyltransferase, partial [Patescibacteria group bacterium]
VLPDLSDGPVGARGGAANIETQLKELKGTLGGERHIVIYDDIIFTGHLLSEACREIEVAGFKIEHVLCGVGIGEGARRMEKNGWTVGCKVEYTEVVDQVCERDFYPGIDYCGRTLATDHTLGFPYLFPFGNPCKWASIPESHAKRFSQFCLEQSVRLFEEIGQQSKRIVLCSHIERKLPDVSENGAIFVDYLRAMERKIA